MSILVTQRLYIIQIFCRIYQMIQLVKIEFFHHFLCLTRHILFQNNKNLNKFNPNEIFQLLTTEIYNITHLKFIHPNYIFFYLKHFHIFNISSIPYITKLDSSQEIFNHITLYHQTFISRFKQYI